MLLSSLLLLSVNALGVPVERLPYTNGITTSDTVSPIWNTFSSSGGLLLGSPGRPTNFREVVDEFAQKLVQKRDICKSRTGAAIPINRGMH
jgi:hypothetical protein